MYTLKDIIKPVIDYYKKYSLSANYILVYQRKCITTNIMFVLFSKAFVHILEKYVFGL